MPAAFVKLAQESLGDTTTINIERVPSLPQELTRRL